MNLNSLKKINLLNLTYDEMKEFFHKLGEKSYRADQVMKWIYHHSCNNFNQMHNLSTKIKKKLISIAEIKSPKIFQKSFSKDGTVKWNFSINNQIIETVFIPEKNRNTICISSQIGCILKCRFCATAQQGFNRNLRVSEIIGQIWNIIKFYKNCVTNIVFMGMGEPLLNLNNVVSAIKIMLHPLGFGFSKRHITLSTTGIIPALNILDKMIDVVLAISLHAPNDKIRNSIIPINKKYNILSLLNSAKKYVQNSKASKGKITIEYVMLDNINDKIENAYELCNLLYKFPCKINLIPWNPFPNVSYQCSSEKKIKKFSEILMKKRFITTIRKNRGNDINAACGQLIGKVKNRIKISTFI